jgi:hypothetical protein
MEMLSGYRTMCGVGVVAAVLAAATFASAQEVGVVSNINVFSNHSEDVSSIEAWKQSYISDGMSDQDKAIAIFNTLVRYRHQATPPSEFLSSGESGGHVHDPFKTIHVYGYGQCCCAAGQASALARYLGLEARGRNITAHSVSEINIDGQWCLIDGSVMNYFVKDDGKLASVDEIHQEVREWIQHHPDLIGNDSALRQFARDGGWRQGPPLLAKAEQFYGEHGVNTAGWHGWSSTMQEYYKVMEPFEFGSTIGYRLNVQLRPGEKITRNFFSRGIEYTNSMNKQYYDELQTRERLGIQETLGDRAPGRVGDGTTEWNVPLALPQLQRSALAVENLAAADTGGIAVADPAEAGVLELRFPNSYVVVKARTGLKAHIPSGGAIAISFSDNNGLDWRPVTTLDRSGEHEVDLTEFALRRYDYRLRFELTGSGTGIESLHTFNDFQCSQAALPAIIGGENTITFQAGPQEGTITIEGNTDAERAEKANQVTIMDFRPVLNGFSENLRMDGGSGDATFSIATPGEMTRLRISSHWRARDERDGFQVQVSFDEGETFTTIDTLPGPYRGMTRYTVFEDVPAGTQEALVRFVGRQVNTAALWDIRIDADYAEPNGGFVPVRITYEWDEAGEAKRHSELVAQAAHQYTINCGPEARVRSYTVELAE